MVNHKFKILLVLCVWLALVNTANADNLFTLSPGIMYFDYEETGDDGSFLDGETGPVYGVTAALEHSFSPKISGVVFGGIYTGTVDYDGQTQSGTPVKTDTQADFFTLGFAAQLPIKTGENNLTLITGYRYKRWERDIQSIGIVSGLYEVYQWQEVFLGAQLLLKYDTNSRISLYGGIFKTRNAEIEIDLVSDGFGKPRLSLGSDTGLEFGVQWMEARKNDRNYGVRLSYKSWKFGRSPNEISSGSSGSVIIHEPRSETANIMFELIIESLR